MVPTAHFGLRGSSSAVSSETEETCGGNAYGGKNAPVIGTEITHVLDVQLHFGGVLSLAGGEVAVKCSKRGAREIISDASRSLSWGIGGELLASVSVIL